MACLQSFDPLLGGAASSKNCSGSVKDDLKEDKVRRQHETQSQFEDRGDMVEQTRSDTSQRQLWVEQHGNASRRTFISAGERYEMVRFDPQKVLP